MSDFPFDSDAEYNRYLFEYRHEGSEWGIEIIARSPADAQARLKALVFARYQGEIKYKIPVPRTGLFRRFASVLWPR
ncbi:hypothetical protein [Shinella oryzae]|uniref:DUF2283 domain-containing protein n=1 Tax=Shinella oryzae TaxID=2871820 RepID=A0ABY9K4C3_9HYPH|nr:hypothetical protein [Shinella oryzae]WLS02359.1 hypothetical protein Q9315_13115 [Shinella oryzae]